MTLKWIRRWARFLDVKMRLDHTLSQSKDKLRSDNSLFQIVLIERGFVMQSIILLYIKETDGRPADGAILAVLYKPFLGSSYSEIKPSLGFEPPLRKESHVHLPLSGRTEWAGELTKWSSQCRFRRSLIIQSCQSSLRPYISSSHCSFPATIILASFHLPYFSSKSLSFPPHCTIIEEFLLFLGSSLLHGQQAKFIYHNLAGLNGQANSWNPIYFLQVFFWFAYLFFNFFARPVHDNKQLKTLVGGQILNYWNNFEYFKKFRLKTTINLCCFWSACIITQTKHRAIIMMTVTIKTMTTISSHKQKDCTQQPLLIQTVKESTKVHTDVMTIHY